MDWIASSLSIVGIYLNAKKNIYCWYFWVLSSLIWIIYSIKTGQIPLAILWIVFFVADIYGYFEWKKK